MVSTSLSSLKFVRLFLLPLLCAAALVLDVGAQTDECRTIDASTNYTVRAVRVEGRWIPPLHKLDLQELVGQKYSPTLVSQAQERVSAYLQKDENKAIESKVLGMYSVLYVRSCVIADDPAKTVDVVIQPIYMRIDLVRVGPNVLPVPRSILPTFYDSVFKPFLVFNPEFAADYDRETGLSPSLGISMNILDLPGLLSGKGASKKDVRLDLKAWGRKSVDNPFYDSAVDLSLSHKRDGRVLEALAIDGQFRADQQPLGQGRHFKNVGRLGASVLIHP